MSRLRRFVVELPILAALPGKYLGDTRRSSGAALAKREGMTTNDWMGAAQRYLERLGKAEYDAFRAKNKKKSARYMPSDYHRELIEALSAGDEHAFKSIKLLRGCDSPLGV